MWKNILQIDKLKVELLGYNFIFGAKHHCTSPKNTRPTVKHGGTGISNTSQCSNKPLRVLLESCGDEMPSQSDSFGGFCKEQWANTKSKKTDGCNKISRQSISYQLCTHM